MPRTKQKIEIHHEPGTHEILYCLEAMPKWVSILLQNSDKQYRDFIKWYAEKYFKNESGGKVTIQNLAKEFGISGSSKITKWITEAYNDIFKLQTDSPDLFKEEHGVKLDFFIKNHDDSACVSLWMPVVPRVYEEMYLPFLKAKVGIEYFWVEKILYSVDGSETEITAWLNGGFVNRYREMLMHRADFENKIGLYDNHQLSNYEIDEKLMRWYK